MPSSRAGALAGALLAFGSGCAPPPLPEAPDDRRFVCAPERPGPGQVEVKRVACSDELPANSEGRVGDLLLRNDRLSVVLRSPAESLTLVGAPGGGAIDAVPPGFNDRLFEAVPVVQGGWIAAQDWTFGEDGEGVWVRLEGPVVAALGLNPPDQPSRVDEGPRASFTWRLAPDSPTLVLEGAEGLYLSGERGVRAGRAGLFHDAVGLYTDATGAEDMGGALRLEGVTELVAAELHELLEARHPGGPRAAGRCEGDEVEVLDASGRSLAWLGPEFDSPMPPEAAALRCLAEGHLPGEPAAPGPDMALRPGPLGGLVLAVQDGRGRPMPATVWVGERRFVLPAEGARLPVGPGRAPLRVERGPAFAPRVVFVEVPERGEVKLDLTLERVIDEETLVLMAPGLDAAPSRSERRLAAEGLDALAAEGVRFTVVTALDEVGRPVSHPHVRGRAGSLALTAEAGAVTSWPWSANGRRSGHGAVEWVGLDPSAVLALARGEDDPPRLTLVDLDWVEAAGPPGAWDPAPDLVRVEGPGDLPAVFALLEAAPPPGLVGPLAWVPVPGGEDLPSWPAVERGLHAGESMATTGPLLHLSLLDEPDSAGGPERALALRLEARADADIERVELYVDGRLAWTGEPLDGDGLRLDHVQERVQGRWALAVARGADWSFSAPLWLGD